MLSERASASFGAAVLAVIFSAACSSSDGAGDDDDDDEPTGSNPSGGEGGEAGTGGAGAGGAGGGGQLPAPTPAKELYLTSLPAESPPANLAGFIGPWNQIDPQILQVGLMGLATAPGGTFQSAEASEDTLTSPWNVALLRTVSAPLAAHTLGGDLTWQLSVDQSAPGAEYFTHLYLAVWTEAVHCVLADWTEASTNHDWGLFPSQGPSQPVALQPCEVPAGARLVLELGYTSKNTHAVLRSGSLSYGGDYKVTFSQDVLFQ